MSTATLGNCTASMSGLPRSTSAGITPGHSVLAPRNQRLAPMTRGVKGVASNQKLHAVARAQIRSTRSRERSFEVVGHFDIDFKRRYLLAPLHPDHDFFRVEHDVPRDRGKDLRPQQLQQFRLAAQAAFMRQEYLQPFPCNRRGSSAATDQPQQTDHAALRPSNRVIKPLRSTGTIMVTVSPIRRRTAST